MTTKQLAKKAGLVSAGLAATLPALAVSTAGPAHADDFRPGKHYAQTIVLSTYGGAELCQWRYSPMVENTGSWAQAASDLITGNCSPTPVPVVRAKFKVDGSGAIEIQEAPGRVSRGSAVVLDACFKDWDHWVRHIWWDNGWHDGNDPWGCPF